MRILFIVASSGIGGAERYAYRLATALANHFGYSCDFYQIRSTGKAQKHADSAINGYIYSLGCRYSFQIIFYISQINCSDYSTIVVTNGQVLSYLSLMARFIRIPIIARETFIYSHIHQSVFSTLFQRLARRLFYGTFSELVVQSTEMMQECLAKTNQRSLSLIDNILPKWFPNAISTSCDQLVPKRVYWVGRLSEERGIRYLSEVLSILDPKISFRIYTTSSYKKNALTDRLMQALYNRGNSEIVWDDRSPYESIPKSSLCILTTPSEPCSNTLIEYIWNGCYAIVRDSGSFPRTIRELLPHRIKILGGGAYSFARSIEEAYSMSPLTDIQLFEDTRLLEEVGMHNLNRWGSLLMKHGSI